MIAEGLALVAPALQADAPPSAYAVQAAIAALHAEAPCAAATDWRQIVALYAVLTRLAPSPVVELNHAAALAMTDGPAAALMRVDALAARGELDGYDVLPAVRADLLRRLGRAPEARAAYERALALCPTRRSAPSCAGAWTSWAEPQLEASSARRRSAPCTIAPSLAQAMLGATWAAHEGAEAAVGAGHHALRAQQVPSSAPAAAPPARGAPRSCWSVHDAGDHVLALGKAHALEGRHSCPWRGLLASTDRPLGLALSTMSMMSARGTSRWWGPS